MPRDRLTRSQRESMIRPRSDVDRAVTDFYRRTFPMPWDEPDKDAPPMPKQLTPHALDVLRSLAKWGPKPAQEVNAGVADKFRREGLAEEVLLPSPYATHKGKLIGFLQITQAGRDRLAESES